MGIVKLYTKRYSLKRSALEVKQPLRQIVSNDIGIWCNQLSFRKCIMSSNLRFCACRAIYHFLEMHRKIWGMSKLTFHPLEIKLLSITWSVDFILVILLYSSFIFTLTTFLQNGHHKHDFTCLVRMTLQGARVVLLKIQGHF